MSEISAKTIVENAGAGWQLPSARLAYGRGFSDWKPTPQQNNLELIPFVEDLLTMAGRQVAVEIGMDKGGTHLVWKHLYDKVISVDINLGNAVMFMAGLLHKPEASRAILSNSQLPLTVKLVEQELNGVYVDFLFIDGDHSYSAVESDYLNYEPFVRSGGVVAFHDVGQPGIRQFVQQMATGQHPVLKHKFELKNFMVTNTTMGIGYYVKP